MAILTTEDMRAEALKVLNEELTKAYITLRERAQYKRDQVLHILAHKEFGKLIEDEKRPD